MKEFNPVDYLEKFFGIGGDDKPCKPRKDMTTEELIRNMEKNAEIMRKGERK